MCSLRSSLLVTSLACTIVLAAQVTIADAGPDQYLCSSNAFLQGNAVASGEVGTWTLVSGAASFSDPNDPGTQVTAEAPGVLVLNWTITDGTNTTMDQVAIWLYDDVAPWANAGPDQVVFVPQSSVQLQGSPYIFPMTCFWTIVAGIGNITDPTDPFATYTGATVGQSILMWSCDNGPCGVSSDDVNITVEEAMALGWVAAMTGVRTAFDQTTGHLSITGPAIIDQVIITDQMGRVVLDRSMNVRSASLDVSHLPIGAYVVRAVMDGTSFNERFVVAR